MVGVEQRGHCVEQVFVLMEVSLIFNQVELKLLPNRLILKRLVVLYVVHQLRKHIVRIVSRDQLLLVRLIKFNHINDLCFFGLLFIKLDWPLLCCNHLLNSLDVFHRGAASLRQ
jgi:hypothetical protein